MLRPRALAHVVAAAMALAVACSKSPTSPSGNDVSGFVNGVSSTGASPATGTQQSGTPPAPSGGPGGTVTGNGSAVNGGSSLIGASGANPFQSVVVSAGNSGGGAATASSVGFPQATTTGSISGFFRVDLPAPVTSVQLVVTFPRAIASTSFDLQIQLVAASGAVGPVLALHETVHTVSAASVQVGVSWDSATDVDLHLIEPSGNEVFFGNPGPSSTGAKLDLDSNGGCIIDSINNENVGWPTGTPASGLYTVRVAYFSPCQFQGTTNFVVTVVNNGAVTPFVSTFTTRDVDTSGKGSGRTITSFTHTGGSASVPGIFEAPSQLSGTALEKLKMGGR